MPNRLVKAYEFLPDAFVAVDFDIDEAEEWEMFCHFLTLLGFVVDPQRWAFENLYGLPNFRADHAAFREKYGIRG
jgi:hypothetical protein